jgi:hypothetical protein
MAITTKKLFLASSSELREDRKDFEIFISRRCKEWVGKGVYLDLVIWEDFLDAMSRTRLQDEYNQAISECDIFVMLFFTKVGAYTEEEFETAFRQFKATNKPFIFTYFKDAEITTGSANKKDLTSLWAFQEKLDALGHFYTRYKNIDDLKYQFGRQLDKLAAGGFIEFKPDDGPPSPPTGDTYQARVTGGGAIAQGAGARAVGDGGVIVGGNSSGSINTGTQIDLGGGTYVGGHVNAGRDFVGGNQVHEGISAAELAALFTPLLAAVAQHAPTDRQTEALQKVSELQAELAKGSLKDDSKVGKLVQGLIDLVPKAVGSVVSLFASPILGGVAGPFTQYVLERIKGS